MSFSADMNTCLNFGVSNLRDKLLTDRVRSNLGVTVEDVDFLDDQLGPRKRWSMSNKYRVIHNIRPKVMAYCS